jgi:hypothetical protein
MLFADSVSLVLMRANSPCLNGFTQLFGGRKPRRTIDKLLALRGVADVLCGAQLISLFGAFLPADLLAGKHILGGARNRIFTRAVTFWAFLGQVLDPGASCRKAVARVQALFALKGLNGPSEDTSAYCEARLRLPVRWLMAILEHITERLTLGQDNSQGRLLVADGTCVSMPDTPALQLRYPQPKGQKPGCGFPLMKLLGLFDLSCGAWLATTHSSRKFHDCRLWRRLFTRLRKGDTIIADRAFCSWVDLARLSARGINVVVRLHQMRTADFRKGKRLGKDDHLVDWVKPVRPKWMSQGEYDTLPAAITVREVRRNFDQKGVRTTQLIVATTLLDPVKHTAEAVAALYARRWQVELNFDDLKTSMHMDILRTKSPAMICRELLMHMIVYNLLRAAMARAEISVEKASFKGTADRLATWSWSIWLAPTRTLAAERTAEMLQSIAADEVPHRPGRLEPRACKRRPKPHALLTSPRHSMKANSHRSKYRKAA